MPGISSGRARGLSQRRVPRRPPNERCPIDGLGELIGEVSDTSLDYDRVTKLPLYAQHGIAEVWIVNLRERRTNSRGQEATPLAANANPESVSHRAVHPRPS
jgi:hypothetical protein